MAFSNVARSETLKAAADLSSKQFFIVELTANVHECDLAIAAGQEGYGILQNIPESGEAGTVAVDGVSKVIAGGTVAIGDTIKSNSSAYGVAVVSGEVFGGAQGVLAVLGRALTSAASGGIFSMELGVQKLSVVSGAAWS